jgi:hypothetical protein
MTCPMKKGKLYVILSLVVAFLLAVTPLLPALAADNGGDFTDEQIDRATVVLKAKLSGLEADEVSNLVDIMDKLDGANFLINALFDSLDKIRPLKRE